MGGVEADVLRLPLGTASATPKCKHANKFMQKHKNKSELYPAKCCRIRRLSVKVRKWINKCLESCGSTHRDPGLGAGCDSYLVRVDSCFYISEVRIRADCAEFQGQQLLLDLWLVCPNFLLLFFLACIIFISHFIFTVRGKNPLESEDFLLLQYTGWPLGKNWHATVLPVRYAVLLISMFRGPDASLRDSQHL